MPNITGQVVIISLFDVFCTKLFLITKMRVATEEFFCYVVLLLLNWSCSWSWSYNFGLGLVLNILVLFPSLERNKISVMFKGTKVFGATG